MKRIGRLLSVLCIILGVPASAFAQSELAATSGTGTVQTGHPASLLIGVTEAEFRVSKCHTKIASQGVDGLVADIGSSSYFSVKATSSLIRNITGLYSNQTFYSSDCRWLKTAYMRLDKSVTAVPTGARWVVVAFPSGSQIGVEWKAGSSKSECSFY